MAEAQEFKLTLVTPEKKMTSEVEIEEVFVPAYRGELNILPGHAPLMTVLETGILKYRLKGQPALVSVAVSWGYCQVNPKGVVILAETAEAATEIDLDRALHAWKIAAEQLEVADLTPEDAIKYRRKLMRAEVRRSLSPDSTTTH